MSKILLDTNAYAAFLAGEEAVLNELDGAEKIYMSVVVLGELYAGFKGGSRERNNKSLLERFLVKPTVLTHDVTHETALIFGHLKDSLKRLGRPIPINDVWIAASAMETGAILVSYDRHFSALPGLRVWSMTHG